jgi:hypothetical protein
MCALRKPFEGSNLPAILFAIMRASPDPLPPGYSPELRALVAALLQPNPSKRPSASEIEGLPFVAAAARQWKETLRAVEPHAPTQSPPLGGGPLATPPLSLAVGGGAALFAPASPSAAAAAAAAASRAALSSSSPVLAGASEAPLLGATTTYSATAAVYGAATAAVTPPAGGGDDAEEDAAAPTEAGGGSGAAVPSSAPSRDTARQRRGGLARSHALALQLGGLDGTGLQSTAGGGTTGVGSGVSGGGVSAFASPAASSMTSSSFGGLSSSTTPGRRDSAAVERALIYEIDQAVALAEAGHRARSGADVSAAVRRLEEIDAQLSVLSAGAASTGGGSSGSGGGVITSAGSAVTPASGLGSAAPQVVSGRVWDALGRSWAELGQWGRAIGAYRRALRSRGAMPPLSAMEQLGNLLVRRAQQVWSTARGGDPAGALQAAMEALEGSSSLSSALLQKLAVRQAAGEEDVGRHHGHHSFPVGEGELSGTSAVGGAGGGGSGSGGGASPSGSPPVHHPVDAEPPQWALAAGALMYEGLAYVERICSLGSTAERRSLLGSAYKRRAWTGLGESRRDDLLASARNYALAAAIEVASTAGVPSPYARLNQLTAEILASSGADAERQA